MEADASEKERILWEQPWGAWWAGKERVFPWVVKEGGGVDRGGGLGEEARWQGLVPSRTSEKVSA